MTQLDIEDRAYGFEIQRRGEMFCLIDRATFNNWGELKQLFATRAEAEDYAWRCSEFKRGRRMSV